MMMGNSFRITGAAMKFVSSSAYQFFRRRFLYMTTP